MKKIIKYVVADILKNKIVGVYTLFLFFLSFGLFTMEDNPTKGTLSLLNVVLLVVPLICLIFSTIYVYNSAEFVALLVSQPVRRKSIWLSLFTGLGVALCTAFFIGVGIPVLIYSFNTTGFFLVVIGLLFSVIFTGLAMLAVVKTRDKARGIGFAILLWLYFSVLFDGIILFLLFQFADYPIERLMVGATFLNPIDLGRILILLQMDISAIMGYTGAIFRNFFGTPVRRNYLFCRIDFLGSCSCLSVVKKF